MAYHLTLSGADDQEGPERFALCSVGAWGKFRAWAATLPGGYEAVKALADSGAHAGTDALAKELLDAWEVDPPEAPGVRATLERLIEVVGEAGDPGETAAVEG
jgi:hypothetical protein